MEQAATGTAFTLFIEEKCSCSLTRILFFFVFYSQGMTMDHIKGGFDNV